MPPVVPVRGWRPCLCMPGDRWWGPWLGMRRLACAMRRFMSASSDGVACRGKPPPSSPPPPPPLPRSTAPGLCTAVEGVLGLPLPAPCPSPLPSAVVGGVHGATRTPGAAGTAEGSEVEPTVAAELVRARRGESCAGGGNGVGDDGCPMEKGTRTTRGGNGTSTLSPRCWLPATATAAAPPTPTPTPTAPALLVLVAAGDVACGWRWGCTDVATAAAASSTACMDATNC